MSTTAPLKDICRVSIQELITAIRTDQPTVPAEDIMGRSCNFQVKVTTGQMQIGLEVPENVAGNGRIRLSVIRRTINGMPETFWVRSSHEKGMVYIDQDVLMKGLTQSPWTGATHLLLQRQ